MKDLYEEYQIALELLNSGNSKNEEKAAKMLKKLANKNYLPAINTYGYCFDYGTGEKKDEKKAFQLYMKAAEQGLAKAQSNVGNCYILGIGVEKDYREAVNG